MVKKYKIIDQYGGDQIAEFFDINKAENYLKEHQRLGKVGLLKGKNVLKIRVVDTDKQALYSAISRNRKAMRKEWFGI